MEACSAAHFRGCEIGKLGHDVRLIAPAYVKPFVKRQKNDATDAETIWDAASRPTMRIVPLKSGETEGKKIVVQCVRSGHFHVDDNAIWGVPNNTPITKEGQSRMGKIKEILLNPGGGLANRVHCVESGIVMASTLEVPLTVLWRIGPHMATPFNALFKPPGWVSIVEASDWEEAKKCTDEFGADTTLNHEEVNEWELYSDAEIVEALSRWERPQISYYRRFFRGRKREKILELADPVAQIVHAEEPCIKGRIGVHIRRSDHLGARTRSPDFAFQFLLDNLPEDKGIFLCTDDDNIERKFIDRYPNRVHFRLKTTRSRSDHEAAIEALIDMSLLSKTDAIIGSFGSTFSKCAAYWGNLPLHIADPWG